MTLDDIERPKRTLVEKSRFTEPTRSGYSLVFLVEGVKRQWGCRNG